MPSDGYSALPASHSRAASVTARAAEEMDMAFESDDEEQQLDTVPLTQHRPPSRMTMELPVNSQTTPAYDFERDYDCPPPGSPPSQSSMALPRAPGNTNGIIPSPSAVLRREPRDIRPSFLRRAVGALLPQHYTRVATSEASSAIGGGVDNDGVFSNVLAKPTPQRTPVSESGDVQIMPEETQKDAPPSYAVAQADSAPPYWETTVHAPAFAGPDDMMIEGLPAGTIFSFAWNFLISISFQFVGFMLTYLLHTTHAAKYGSRAGLGVTLIQYGLYSRDADLSVGYNGDGDGEVGATGFSDRTIRMLRRGYRSLSPRSWASPASASEGTSGESMQSNYMMSSAHDWLSFLLMTIGWFLLLSSLLGFARVKRWERSIRNSTPESTLSPDDVARDAQVRDQLQRVFGIDFGPGDDEEVNERPQAGARIGQARNHDSTEPQEDDIRRDLRAMGLI